MEKIKAKIMFFYVMQVLQSAVRRYAPSTSPGRGFFGTRGQGLGRRMSHFHRNIQQMWDAMHDWDWDIDFNWQPFRNI